MLPVYQAFDRAQFAEVATDGAEDLEGKLARASEIFALRQVREQPEERQTSGAGAGELGRELSPILLYSRCTETRCQSRFPGVTYHFLPRPKVPVLPTLLPPSATRVACGFRPV